MDWMEDSFCLHVCVFLCAESPCVASSGWKRSVSTVAYPEGFPKPPSLPTDSQGKTSLQREKQQWTAEEISESVPLKQGEGALTFKGLFYSPCFFLDM